MNVFFENYSIKLDLGEKGFTIMIFIFIIIIISFVYYFATIIFGRKKMNYHLNEFWESRYSLYPREIDWYITFKKICDDFDLEEKFRLHLSNPTKAKFLELGCGNSSLANDLYDKGYKNISALDFSINVIERMKTKYANKSIKFLTGDYLRLEEYFQQSSFDCIIEKAGLDSIATKDSDDVPHLLKSAYEQIYYVLKNGGLFISISNKNFGKNL